MTGAVATADPAAPATGNATLLSAGNPPAEPVTPPDTSAPGGARSHTPPAKPPATDPPATDPPADPPAEEQQEGEDTEGVPDEYGQFVLPEGVTVDQKALDAALPAFKEAKLTKAQAEVAVGIYSQIQQQKAEAQAAQVQQWANEVVADKEIGGDRMVENVEAAVRVLKKFGTPELDQLLTSTGLGNHKELVRFCARVGKQFSDDSHVTGGSQPPAPVDFATEYYAKMPKRERVS